MVYYMRDKRRDLMKIMAVLLLFIIAIVLLFSNLGVKYLWQDEAATAVLGERMMKFGKPLAYDGVNLITMDHFAGEDVSGVKKRSADPEIAVKYYADHGDYKRDTTWIGQPWGQFLVAGISLRFFRHNTIAARLPFVIAAFLTIILLYWFVEKEFKDFFLGWITVALLISNVFWVIHSRQCRYYALSSLFLLLTIIAFIRWQHGRPWGVVFFIVTAFFSFQVDYGFFFPMIVILLLTATWGTWPDIRQVLYVSIIIGIIIAPWFWYYQLINRVKTSAIPWHNNFLLNFFHLNQFLIPVIILLFGCLILSIRWRQIDRINKMLLFVSFTLILTSLLWVPTVTPYAFYRYIVQLTPIASLCSAWVLNEVSILIISRTPHPGEKLRYLIVLSFAFFMAVCPFFSNLVPIQFTKQLYSNSILNQIIKPDWSVLYKEIFPSSTMDPNRKTVEDLSRIASSNDEILINYEDVPLMFYTDCRIRGGISCFRVNDSNRTPPRFLIYRRSVNFVHTSIFNQEIMRYHWRRIDSNIPDITWGNNPEPEFRINLNKEIFSPLLFAENIDLKLSSK
jgi:hypothetical protein